MSSIFSCFAQYQTFDKSFYFIERKGKRKGEIELKVYDLAANLLSTKTISIDYLNKEFHLAKDEGKSKGEIFASDSAATFVRTFSEHKGVKDISWLLDNGYIPKEDGTFSKPEDSYDIDNTLKALNQIILTIEPKVSFDVDEVGFYTCPITQSLFIDPVIDEHGHTFEKDEIETWLKTSNLCPVSKQPINSLIPNRALKDIIEKQLSKKFKILTLSDFKSKDDGLAQGYINQAHLHEDRKEYEKALEQYRLAFCYTNSSEDYANLVQLFKKEKDDLKQCLATLYLAKYQLKENKPEKALESLYQAQLLQKDNETLLLPLAILLKHADKPKAFDLFCKLGEYFSKNKKVDEAKKAYEEAIELNPLKIEIFGQLANLYKEERKTIKQSLDAAQKEYNADTKNVEKKKKYDELEDTYKKCLNKEVYLYLKGAINFLNKDNKVTQDFCKKAIELDPKNPNTYLLYIKLLKEEMSVNELKEVYCKVASLYKEQKNVKAKLATYKQIVQLDKNDYFYRKIVNGYLKFKNENKSFQYYLDWILLYLSEKNYNEAEKIINIALENLPSMVAFDDINKLTHFNYDTSDKLKKLLAQLFMRTALFYETKEIDKAKEIYKQIEEKFQSKEAAFVSAKLYEKGKSISIYKKLADEAFNDEDTHFLYMCVLEIRKTDPKLMLLNENEKKDFRMYSHITKEHEKTEKLSKDIEDMKLSQCNDIYAASKIGAMNFLQKNINNDTVNKLNEDGLAPLHIAILNNQKEAVEFLLNINADSKLKVEEVSGSEINNIYYSYKPLHLAAQKGNGEIIKSILTKSNKELESMLKNIKITYQILSGVSTGLLFGNPIASQAITIAFDSSINKLSEIQKNIINCKGRFGRIPLHMSCYKGHLLATKLLLLFDIDPNVKTTDEGNGVTPLHDAVSQGHFEIVKQLLKHKNINPNVTDKINLSPLHYAVLISSSMIVQMLSDSGKLILPSDPNDPNHIDNLIKENDKQKKVKGLERKTQEIEKTLKALKNKK